ncbi:hypothetical protein LXL04_038506 [Taraxacum kok-saghyz]
MFAALCQKKQSKEREREYRAMGLASKYGIDTFKVLDSHLRHPWPSHGVVSTIGVLPNSQSLDTVGIFARNPSVLHRVGHVLLRLNPLEPRRTKHIIVADDLFQLSKVSQQKTVYIVSKVTEKLSGYQQPKHMNIGQYIFHQMFWE